jgi:hypothetical protein
MLGMWREAWGWGIVASIGVLKKVTENYLL